MPPSSMEFALHTTRSDRREVLQAVCIMVSGLTLLAGCAEPRPPLRVGSVVYPTYELMFLARELGTLDERQIRLIEMRSNADLLRALAAGQLEAATLNFDELMAARADGLDLRTVLVMDVSVGADAVMTRAPLTLQQLRGARLGVDGGVASHTMLNAMLRAGGLTPGDVRRVRLDAEDAERAYTPDKLTVWWPASRWCRGCNRGAATGYLTAQPWMAGW